MQATLLKCLLGGIDDDGNGKGFRIENLLSGKTFHNAHRTMALRTLWNNWLAGGAASWFRRLSKQKATELKQWSTLPVGEPSEISNSGKTLGQDMLHEPPKELGAIECDGALLVVIHIILPTEANVGFGDGNNPMVGDGDAMGIASQVLKNVVWPAKRWFRIYDPILLE